jgi:hypothetical protein
VSSESIARNPEIREQARRLREHLAAGRSIEEALAALRAADAGIIVAIGAAMLALDISLRDARELVETSPAFNDQAHLHADLRRELLERLAPQIESNSATGARAPVAEDT